MKEQITIETIKIAINIFLFYYTFNKINGYLVTFSNQFCFLLSKYLFQVTIAIIKGSNKMRCGSACFPTSYKTVFHYYHFFSGLHKGIGYTQSTNTSSNNHHIGF